MSSYNWSSCMSVNLTPNQLIPQFPIAVIRKSVLVQTLKNTLHVQLRLPEPIENIYELIFTPHLNDVRKSRCNIYKLEKSISPIAICAVRTRKWCVSTLGLRIFVLNIKPVHKYFLLNYHPIEEFGSNSLTINRRMLANRLAKLLKAPWLEIRQLSK